LLDVLGLAGAPPKRTPFSQTSTASRRVAATRSSAERNPPSSGSSKARRK